MAMFTDLKGRVLDFVNKVRSRYGVPTLAELPAGIPGNEYSCVIAKALTFTTPDGVSYQASVGGADELYLEKEDGDWDDEDLTTQIKAPSYINDFISAFDDRKMPSLISADAPEPAATL